MPEVPASNAGAGAALYCARGPPSPEQLLSDDGVEGLRFMDVLLLVLSEGPVALATS